MDTITESHLKDDAFKWAIWEFQHDPKYWRDRLENGSGLIRSIASFVMRYGQPAQDRGQP